MSSENKHIWFDISEFDRSVSEDITSLLDESPIYNGLVMKPDQYEFYENDLDKKNRALIFKIESSHDVSFLKNIFNEFDPHQRQSPMTIMSSNSEMLSEFKDIPIKKARHYTVSDNKTLLDTIEQPGFHDYVILNFMDPTNIPLELVLASLQGSKTQVVKEITSKEFIDDAVVCFGVMEHGAGGVIFSPDNIEVLQKFIASYKAHRPELNTLPLQECTVTESKYVGMGNRACVDLVAIFDENEGLLIGSTSSGGIFCCPEVFYLPYMELRPFRVNAGGIHSYIFHHDESTNYLSELKSGSRVTVISHAGKLRPAIVGRIKVEVRPLRLIKAVFPSGSEINVILQDDWHVRVFSADAKPMHVSNLRPGDKLLGLESTPGRHVGIKIVENIFEQ